MATFPLRLSLAFLAAAALVAPASRAADAPADPAAGLKAAALELETALKAKDEGAVAVAAKKIPPLYKDVADAGARASAMKALGAAVKNAKMTSARRDALAAVVETEDGKEAWKAISSAYPDDDVEDESKWNVEYVRAVGALHPEGAIDRLLETFRKAKQADLAAAAVLALGNYGKSKQREKILAEVVKAGKNMVPARSASKNPSAEATARWGVLREAIGKALDTLTGNAIGAPDEWFKRVDETKGSLKSLFKD